MTQTHRNAISGRNSLKTRRKAAAIGTGFFLPCAFAMPRLADCETLTSITPPQYNHIVFPYAAAQSAHKNHPKTAVNSLTALKSQGFALLTSFAKQNSQMFGAQNSLPAFNKQLKTAVDGFPTLNKCRETAVDGLPAFNNHSKTTVDGLPALDKCQKTMVDAFPVLNKHPKTAVDSISSLKERTKTAADAFPLLNKCQKTAVDALLSKLALYNFALKLVARVFAVFAKVSASFLRKLGSKPLACVQNASSDSKSLICGARRKLVSKSPICDARTKACDVDGISSLKERTKTAVSALSCGFSPKGLRRYIIAPKKEVFSR